MRSVIRCPYLTRVHKQVIIATASIERFNDPEPEPLEQPDFACTLFQEMHERSSAEGFGTYLYLAVEIAKVSDASGPLQLMLLCLRQKATQIRIEALQAEPENVDPRVVSDGSSSMPHTKAPSPALICPDPSASDCTSTICTSFMHNNMRSQPP